MSFATVVALIATYETIRARYPRFVRHSVRRRIGVYLSGTLLTSFVAGLATAPYAAFHFDRFRSQLGCAAYYGSMDHAMGGRRFRADDSRP
ncbi:MAG TPA: hypothetical protein EYQ81_15470 [Sneathiellales bacterium]|nr:hypothetical protein [Sneathiellales bacterium]